MSSYVNDWKKVRVATILRIEKIAGWALLFISLLLTVFVVMAIGELEMSFLEILTLISLSLSPMLAAALLFWHSQYQKKMCDRAAWLENYFSAIPEGKVTLRETAATLGMTTGEAKKLLDRLISGKYLKNCAFSQEDGTNVIVLSGAVHQQGSKAAFEMRTCPGCGAASRQKIGYEGVCPYCGRHF